MGILITILLGGLAGWIASKIMRTDASMGVLMNVIVGVIGAFLANLLLANITGVEARLDTFDIWSFLSAVGGAVVLLAIVNLFTRGRAR